MTNASLSIITRYHDKKIAKINKNLWIHQFILSKNSYKLQETKKKKKFQDNVPEFILIKF